MMEKVITWHFLIIPMLYENFTDSHFFETQRNVNIVIPVLKFVEKIVNLTKSIFFLFFPPWK